VDTLATALREFQEEIGIDPENVQIVGQLDQVTVGSRYLVTPFVGIVMSPFKASPNKEEVSPVISLPVSALLDPDCFTSELKTGKATRHLSLSLRSPGYLGRHRENSQTVTGGGLWVSGKRQTGLA
jgi:hypothetical protein